MHKTASIVVLSFGLTVFAFAQANVAPPPIAPVPVPPSNRPDEVSAKPKLVWDAETKNYASKPGEATAPFAFTFTNVSQTQVVISNAVTSCGCTVAQLPMQPWPIAPGATGEIKVTMNLAGKMGHVTKQVTVNSSEGSKFLSVSVDVAPAAAPATENMRGDRNANIEKAKADRQLVFKGDCRSCHVDKGVGKTGAELYAADCGVCHDSPRRASMVPDLRAPRSPRDHEFWESWIAHGRSGSLMPAFAVSEGGPLTEGQIKDLVVYLEKNFPQGSVGVPRPAIVFPKATSSTAQ